MRFEIDLDAMVSGEDEGDLVSDEETASEAGLKSDNTLEERKSKSEHDSAELSEAQDLLGTDTDNYD